MKKNYFNIFNILSLTKNIKNKGDSISSKMWLILRIYAISMCEPEIDYKGARKSTFSIGPKNKYLSLAEWLKIKLPVLKG